MSKSAWITDEFPDESIQVLVRCANEEYPICLGYMASEKWYTSDDDLIRDGVIGWMDMSDAADLLDGKVPA